MRRPVSHVQRHGHSNSDTISVQRAPDTNPAEGASPKVTVRAWGNGVSASGEAQATDPARDYRAMGQIQIVPPVSIPIRTKMD